MLKNAIRTALFRFACLTFVLALPTSHLAWAKKHPVAARGPDANYISALNIANRFLEAWRNNDPSAAMPLLTNHAKQQSTEDGIDKLFDGPTTRGFEVPHGKAVRAGRYSFPLVLLQTDDSGHTRRKFGEIIILNTGKNDWAVDKLP